MLPVASDHWLEEAYWVFCSKTGKLEHKRHVLKTVYKCCQHKAEGKKQIYAILAWILLWLQPILKLLHEAIRRKYIWSYFCSIWHFQLNFILFMANSTINPISELFDSPIYLLCVGKRPFIFIGIWTSMSHFGIFRMKEPDLTSAIGILIKLSLGWMNLRPSRSTCSRHKLKSLQKSPSG